MTRVGAVFLLMTSPHPRPESFDSRAIAVEANPATAVHPRELERAAQFPRLEGVALVVLEHEHEIAVLHLVERDMLQVFLALARKVAVDAVERLSDPLRDVSRGQHELLLNLDG